MFSGTVCGEMLYVLAPSDSEPASPGPSDSLEVTAEVIPDHPQEKGDILQ